MFGWVWAAQKARIEMVDGDDSDSVDMATHVVTFSTHVDATRNIHAFSIWPC